MIWALVAVAVGVYAGALVALARTHRLGRDKTFSLFGPALMLKTQRGRSFLDRVGRARRFWNAFGDLGIALAFLAMATIVVLLVWEAIIASTLPASVAPSPSEALGLPGINPYIPWGYGILALIIGVGLHELCHGILARANNIPVKTLGVLFLVIPIGAFVEQDEEAMTRASPRRRDRVAAAGVMANFALAGAFFLVLAALFSTAIQPAAPGVAVASVFSGSPAGNVSLASGDIITSLNHTATPTSEDLRTALGEARPGETVWVTWYSPSRGGIIGANVTLGSESAFIPSLAGNATAIHQAFLGIYELPVPPQTVATLFTNPLSPSITAGSPGGRANPFGGVLLFLALPFVAEEPIQGSEMGLYTIHGPLSAVPGGAVWILVNTLYWLVWMNFLLGLSNALPAVPFDGGFLFRDLASGVVRRLRKTWTAPQVEGVVSRLSILATFAILLLIVWQFVGPRL